MKRILFAVLLALAGFFAVGCVPGNCPELITYREGLHALDASLYQQHRQLLEDAIAKGIRSPADKQVVDAEIGQAESQYSKSKIGDNPSTR